MADDLTRVQTNPYLQCAQAVAFGQPDRAMLDQLPDQALRSYIDACATARTRLIPQFAWAIPNHAALVALAASAPLIELGAGTGYWAYLLRERGVDIVAFDTEPPQTTTHQNQWQRSPMHVGTCWTDVQMGTPAVLRGGQYRERTLFLCWPPPTTMALEALDTYAGETVALIGCGPDETGCLAFYDLLLSQWKLIQTVAIPQWCGVPDTLTIYQRRATTA